LWIQSAIIKTKGKNMKRILLFLMLFIMSINYGFSETNKEEQSPEIMEGNGPFLLSLSLSHGSGLYALKQPKAAFPYLMTHIFLVDIPLVILLGAIIVNNISPGFYQGTALTITEYVVNTCVISILVSIPVIRFFECRKVLKTKKKLLLD
jgi:hypothetical protein